MTSTEENSCWVDRIKTYSALDYLKILSLLVFLFFVSHQLHAKVRVVKPAHVTQDTRYCASQTLQNGEYDIKSRSWKSSKCDIHFYSKKDIGACTEKIYEAQKRPLWVMMFGDSKVRDLLKHFAKTLNMTCQYYKPEEISAKKLYFTNITAQFDVRYFDKFGVTMRVCTSETLHMTASHYVMKYYRNDERVDNVLKQSVSPDIVLFGMSGWYIQDFPNVRDRNKLYREDTKRLNEKIRRFAPNTAVIWKHGEITPKSWRGGQNEEIVRLNNFAEEDFRNNSRVNLWDVPRNALKNFRDFTDVVHYLEPSYNASFQSLFNFYCNPVMKWGPNYCCNNVRHSWSTEPPHSSVKPPHSSKDPPFSYSAIAVNISQISVLLLLCCSFIRCLKGEFTTTDSKNESNISLFDCVWNLLKFICIINYFILCEREKIFNEISKSNISPFLLVICLSCGFVTIKTSKLDSGVLNRDVTSEWKGWMQMMILIYHYCGLSKNLIVYMHIRILVAAYIFLTGYGHYCYVSSGKSMSLKRYISVMFRMNFLTILLCFTMSQSYMNYYFVPLISFWFTVVYLFLYIVVKVNKLNGHQIFAGKTLIIPVILMMTFNEVFPYEYVFQLIYGSTLESSHEWFFRSRLDRMSAFTGVLFGMYIQYSKDSDFSTDTKTWKAAKISLSLLGLSTYFILSSFCATKEQCNIVHPIISWIPIISYICLRHADERFSKYHSEFFSWVGSFSLELFLCQYHIWMSDNTHSILILIPDQFLLNLTLTTVSLFLISHEIHKVTNFVTKLLAMQ